MKPTDILSIIDNMIANATEWTIGEDMPEGYWRGVVYMVSSILEHYNKESEDV